MTTLLREVADRASVGRETRDHTAPDLECRATDDGKVTFDGIASVIDTPYTVRDALGEYSETIAKGAFSRTLKAKADVRLLVNHTGVPLARTKSKTLDLSAAPDLRAVATLDPSNPTVQEVRSAMERGDLDQMSIGMRVTRQEWNGDYTERTIKEAELFDVSVVTNPASPTTTATLRSVDELIATIAEAELTEEELRRAIRTMERRFADMYSSDVRGLLNDALQDLLKPTATQYVWVCDFSDTTVIYETCGFVDNGYFQLGYSVNAGSVVPDTADPVAVTQKTIYEPEPSDRSANPFELRDRDDADRLALRRRQLITV